MESSVIYLAKWLIALLTSGVLKLQFDGEAVNLRGKTNTGNTDCQRNHQVKGFTGRVIENRGFND
jgi:hypothetical protein